MEKGIDEMVRNGFYLNEQYRSHLCGCPEGFNKETGGALNETEEKIQDNESLMELYERVLKATRKRGLSKEKSFK
nr:hypothetical protein [Desulfobacterales bacterium]